MFLLTFALILDWFVGEPDALWRRVPHPVVMIGKLIDWFDRYRDKAELAQRFNLAQDRFELWTGGALVVALLALSLLVTWVVYSLSGPLSWLLELGVVTILVAQKSLKDHVQAVVDALQSDGLAGGRKAVSMIVGRDVSQLDESGVAKAAVESLAENVSDGVVAPVVWYAIAGLPGIIFYKAINTADSMIGHRTDRHEFFGKASALTDDLLNWPAARLTALLVTVIALMTQGRDAASQVWDVVLRDAGLHRSPNAGWPETAYAAELGLSLGGPRRYGADVVVAPSLNASGRSRLGINDISRALLLFRRCCFLLIGLCGLAFIIV